ncbi:MAG: PH domain-containing protein [Acidimicrobiaceae bacterium]|nr:PH domain-containing protein [Acidimicrobiaceae bacterium]
MRLSQAKRTQLVRLASPALAEGEKVVDVTIGSAEVTRNGKRTRRKATILVTDRRVIVFSRRLGGYDVQEYAFSRISGVDHTKGLTAGQLTLRASGGGADISQVDKTDVERIARVIRDRMALPHEPAAGTVPPLPESSGNGDESATEDSTSSRDYATKD